MWLRRGHKKREVITRFGDKGEAVELALYKEGDSNVVQVARNIEARLGVVRSDLPEGIELTVGADQSRFIRASIDEVRNIAERFSDGSIRLVRDLPVDSSAWKRLYHRGRNAVEGRNSIMEAWGFKRMPVYGKDRVKAIIFQADVWANLTTLARLIREATIASRVT